MRTSMLRIFAMTLFCLAVLCCQAIAQNRIGSGKESVNIKGKIESVKGNLLQIAGDNGGRWIVKAPDNSQSIMVEGIAYPNWLKRGMVVRFSGKFDRAGKSHTLVEEIEVLSFPNKNIKMGVVPAPDFLGVEVPQEKKETTNQPAKPDENPLAPFQVTGRLTGLKQGSILVRAGNALVSAKLSDDARFISKFQARDTFRRVFR